MNEKKITLKPAFWQHTKTERAMRTMRLLVLLEEVSKVEEQTTH